MLLPLTQVCVLLNSVAFGFGWGYLCTWGVYFTISNLLWEILHTHLVTLPSKRLELHWQR